MPDYQQTLSTMLAPPFPAAHGCYVKSLYNHMPKNEHNWVTCYDLWHAHACTIHPKFEHNWYVLFFLFSFQRPMTCSLIGDNKEDGDSAVTALNMCAPMTMTATTMGL